MAFVSTSFRQAVQGGLTNGKGAIWAYAATADSSSSVGGSGYFSSVMKGSRGNGGMGPQVGDLCVVTFGTSTVRWGTFSASTANVSGSTNLSSNYNCGYDGTLSLT